MRDRRPLYNRPHLVVLQTSFPVTFEHWKTERKSRNYFKPESTNYNSNEKQQAERRTSLWS